MLMLDAIAVILVSGGFESGRETRYKYLRSEWVNTWGIYAGGGDFEVLADPLAYGGSRNPLDGTVLAELPRPRRTLATAES
jgi:hypothetical protein